MDETNKYKYKYKYKYKWVVGARWAGNGQWVDEETVRWQWVPGVGFGPKHEARLN